MRRLSLTVNICHALIASTNIAVGLMIFRKGPLHGAINFGVAIGATVANFYYRRNERRLQQLVARRDALMQQLENQMTKDEAGEAYRKAAENLMIVAKATGAEVTVNFDAARIRLGGSWFHISHNHISRTRKDGTRQSTCLTYGFFMPQPEKIAATLLLLKNDPKIFDRWKKHDYYYA